MISNCFAILYRKDRLLCIWFWLWSFFFISNGCAQVPAKSFHEKSGWRAESYFDDPKVIALCKAIEADDSKEIVRLIKEGADVNAKGKGNMTPLLWAFPDNKPERFKILLEHGANPNVVIESDFGLPGGMMVPGECVTELAAKSNFPTLFEEVMKHGGNPHFINTKTKRSLLSTLIQYGGDPARVQTLIDRGVDLNNMSTGVPPAIQAALHFGQYELALMLLKAGADPKLYVEEGNKKLTHILLEAKSSVDSYERPENKKAYEKLVEWLKENGESFEEAQADLDRWKRRAHLSSAEKGRLRRAEIAERKAREAAEKAKKEKKP